MEMASDRARFRARVWVAKVGIVEERSIGWVLGWVGEGEWLRDIRRKKMRLEIEGKENGRGHDIRN